MRPALRWDRVATIALHTLLGVTLFIGLDAAMSSRGVVPDYDGLSYVDAALRVHLGLAGAGIGVASQTGSTGTVIWAGLPFTNTLDVLLLGLLYDVLDFHVGVWLIHSAYLVLFVVLARRILSPAVVLALFACAVAHAYFLHQYANFISEMKVGLLLALFVAYLFHEAVARHWRALAGIAALLILARTINLLFIGPLVGVQVLLRWRGARADATAAMKAVGLAVLALSPMIAYHSWYMVPYMARMGYSDVVKNWKDMTGVYDKLGLLTAYESGLRAYNMPLVAAFAAVIAAGIARYALRRERRLRLARDAAIALAVVFAVLMQAQTNNIMVVYWVYILLALAFVLFLRELVGERYTAVAALALAAIALRQEGLDFVRFHRELARTRPVMEMANSLGRRIGAADAPVVFANFRGVGPLDVHGFEVALGRVIGWPEANVISYSTPLESYVKAIDSANIVLVANRNFMWPAFLGVNHKTAQIAGYMEKNAERMGFEPSERVLFDEDTSRFVTVYERPTAVVKLEYAWYDDLWMDEDTPVVLRSPRDSLTGFALELRLMVPQVVDPSFAPPVTATLVSADGKPLRSAVASAPGEVTLSFPLDGLAPGNYRLRFDKTFAPPGDPRHLAALYRGSSLARTAR